MQKKHRRYIIIALVGLGAFSVLSFASILADATGLIGPKEIDCCANGWDPGPPEVSVEIPPEKL